jgi:signal transduction histidine kinase/ligand-binding sensor protein
LVDLDRLKSIFEKFSQATGCMIGFLTYPDQKILVATGWRDICSMFHRADPESTVVCVKCNKSMTSKATKEGEVAVELCDHCLVDGGVPVIIKGTRLATLMTGQVFFEPPDIERFKRQAQEFGYNWEKYLAAVRQVPIVDEQKFRATLSFLSDLATLIAELGYAKLEMRDKADLLAQEIAERKQAEEVDRRLTRELRAILECNQALVRASDEQALLKEICRIIVSVTGYCMAWVGFAEQDDDQRVRPVAWAGNEVGYLHDAHITWADVERGRGPSGTAIRTGKVQVVRDIPTHPDFGPWREQAAARGYRSVIVLPLMADGQAFGNINIYSATSADFGDDEVRLLTQLAQDVTYGITTLRMRTTHDRAVSELVGYRHHLQELVAQRTAQLNEKNEKLRVGIAAQARSEHELRQSHEELKAAQMRLIEAAKRESVGTLAAGVAHEVKNPLAVILMGVDILQHRLSEDPDLHAVVEDIRTAVERADRVTRGLLNYASSTRLDLRPASINQILSQVLHLIRPQMVAHHIKVLEDLEPNLPLVLVDALKMEQVFVNILRNAQQAMPDGGVLHVRSYSMVWEGRKAYLSGSRLMERLHAGDRLVAVDIDDTGTGISEEAMHRIGDPFFTTKPPGLGTGLGLPVTMSIIELHGGAIDISNNPEGGVQVTIYLKIQQGDNHVGQCNTPAHPDPGH